MSGFDPSKLTTGGAKPQRSNRGPRAERVFLAVEEYQTPAEGFHYAIGHKVDAPDEKVKVRLNTVAERQQDRPNDSADKIKSQYVTGENTRDSLADKSKAGITLISFDDARKVGADENGVTEYRAHWPKTISTDPSAEVFSGVAHVRLRDASEGPGGRRAAQAYVELLEKSAVVDGSSVDKALGDALAIKDEQGRARDPLVILRAAHEGNVVLTGRVYPSNEETQVFDQNLGENKTVYRKVDAEATIDRLLSGEPGRNDFENRQLDTARALVAGLKGLDEPKFNSPDESVRDSMRNLYYGAKSGALEVEITSAIKIDFGADTRKTYLKDKDRPQLAAYTIKETLEGGDEPRVRESAGYTNTVVAVHRHQAGEPYAVFASPTEMYPKAQKLADLKLASAPELAAEKGKEAEAERKPEPEPEPEPASSPSDDFEP